MTEDRAVLDDPILRAQEAERIVTSPVWVDVWQQMEASILDAWKSAPIRDAEGMAELKRMHLTLTSVRANLESAIASGKIEKANQEHSLRQRVANLFR